MNQRLMDYNHLDDSSDIINVKREYSSSVVGQFEKDLDPISQYNQFIDVYNNQTNIIDNIELQKMKLTESYKKFYVKMEQKCIFSVILLIPLINLIYYFKLWRFQFIQTQANKVFKKNQLIIQDPFKNMIYSPEICHSLKRDIWYFDIKLNELSGLQFNQDIIRLQYQRNTNSDGRIKFMIYNTTFAQKYLDFTQHQYIPLMWILYSTLILVVHGLGFYYLLNKSYQ